MGFMSSASKDNATARPVHRQEKEQFEKLFKQENIDRFEDRFKILEIFLRTEQHITEAELADILKESGHDFSIEFVRETLELMQQYGFAHANRFDNGNIRYEHRHLGQHHDHIVCTKCRKIVEFNNPQMEELQRQIAAAQGFHILQHRMELYGICSDCMKLRIPVIPLSLAKQGERLTIREFTGGVNARMRLMSMGLRAGDEIEVLTNLNSGQVVVALDYSRYALGRGLAEKIMVQPVDGNREASFQ